MSTRDKFAFIFLQNPFCRLGLFANPSRVERVRALKKYNAYSQAGRMQEYYDAQNSFEVYRWLISFYKDELALHQAPFDKRLKQAFFDDKVTGKSLYNLQNWFLNDEVGTFDFIKQMPFSESSFELDLRLWSSSFDENPIALHNRIVIGLFRLALATMAKEEDDGSYYEQVYEGLDKYFQKGNEGDIDFKCFEDIFEPNALVEALSTCLHKDTPNSESSDNVKFRRLIQTMLLVWTDDPNDCVSPGRKEGVTRKFEQFLLRFPMLINRAGIVSGIYLCACKLFSNDAWRKALYEKQYGTQLSSKLSLLWGVYRSISLLGGEAILKALPNNKRLVEMLNSLLGENGSQIQITNELFTLLSKLENGLNAYPNRVFSAKTIVEYAQYAPDIWKASFKLFPNFSLGFWDEFTPKFISSLENYNANGNEHMLHPEYLPLVIRLCRNFLDMVREPQSRQKLQSLILSLVAKKPEDPREAAYGKKDDTRFDVHGDNSRDNKKTKNTLFSLKEFATKHKAFALVLSIGVLFCLVWTWCSKGEVAFLGEQEELFNSSVQAYLYDGSLENWFGFIDKIITKDSQLPIDIDKKILAAKSNFGESLALDNNEPNGANEINGNNKISGTKEANKVNEVVESARYYLAAVALKLEDVATNNAFGANISVNAKAKEREQKITTYLNKSLALNPASPAVYLLADKLKTTAEKEHFERKLFCSVQKNKVAERDYEILEARGLISNDTKRFIERGSDYCKGRR